MKPSMDSVTDTAHRQPPLKKAWAYTRGIFTIWQDVLIWLPIAVGLLLLMFHWIPRIDPASGIDGFGDLFAFLVQMIKAITICFLAWLAKRTYCYDSTRDLEERLTIKILDGSRNDYERAKTVLIEDRLVFAAFLIFFTVVATFV